MTIHCFESSSRQPRRAKAPGPEQRESSPMARYCLPPNEHRMY
jgi:hypothetical protein